MDAINIIAETNTQKEENEMTSKVMEKINEVDEGISYVLDMCIKILDSRLGRFADRLENMNEPISDTELNQSGGKMEAFDSKYFYPVLANGTIPTWRDGYMPLYTRVNGGFMFTTMALNDQVLADDDEKYDSRYFNADDRDFVVIDLAGKSREIREDIFQLMEMVEK